MMREQHKDLSFLYHEVPRHKGSKGRSNQRNGDFEWMAESMALGLVKNHIYMQKKSFQ